MPKFTQDDEQNNLPNTNTESGFESLSDVSQDQNAADAPLTLSSEQTTDTPSLIDGLDDLNKTNPEEEQTTEEEDPEEKILTFIPSSKVNDYVTIDGQKYTYGYLNGKRVEVPCDVSVELPRKHANLFKALLDK